MPMPIVQFENVRKHYQMGLVTVEALRGVSFGIAPGDYISIMGQPKLAALLRELNWTQNLLSLARARATLPKAGKAAAGVTPCDFASRSNC